jgi:hypothetical protein
VTRLCKEHAWGVVMRAELDALGIIEYMSPTESSCD